MAISRYKTELCTVTLGAFNYHAEEKIFNSYKEKLDKLTGQSSIDVLILDETYKPFYDEINRDTTIKKHIRDLLILFIKLYRMSAALDFISDIETENKNFNQVVERHQTDVSLFSFDEKTNDFTKIEDKLEKFASSVRAEVKKEFKITNDQLTKSFQGQYNYLCTLESMVDDCKSKNDYKTQLKSILNILSPTKTEMECLLGESKDEPARIFVEIDAYFREHNNKFAEIESDLAKLTEHYETYSTLLDERKFVTTINNVNKSEVKDADDKASFDEHLKIKVNTLLTTDKAASIEALKSNNITETVNNQYSYFAWYASYIVSNKAHVELDKFKKYSESIYKKWYGLDCKSDNTKSDPNITSYIKKILAERDELKNKYNFFLKNALQNRRERFQSEIKSKLLAIEEKHKALKYFYNEFCKNINGQIKKKLEKSHKDQIKAIIHKCDTVYSSIMYLPKTIAVQPKQKPAKSSSMRNSMRASLTKKFFSKDADVVHFGELQPEYKDEDILGDYYSNSNEDRINSAESKYNLKKPLLEKNDQYSNASEYVPMMRQISKKSLLGAIFSITLGTILTALGGPVGWAIGGLFLFSGGLFVISGIKSKTAVHQVQNLESQPKITSSTASTLKKFEEKAFQLGLDPKKGNKTSTTVTFSLKNGGNLVINDQGCKLFKINKNKPDDMSFQPISRLTPELRRELSAYKL